MIKLKDSKIEGTKGIELVFELNPPDNKDSSALFISLYLYIYIFFLFCVVSYPLTTISFV